MALTTDCATTNHPSALSQEILAQIASAVGSIQHGSVQITIQDSKVIQIEKAEKIRVKSASLNIARRS